MKKLIAISITLGILFVSGWLLLFLWPKPKLLATIPFSQVIQDAKGHLLRLTLTADEKYRVFTPLSQINPLLIEATLLQEDRFFWWHPGINFFSVGRAVSHTFLPHSQRMGASTITMQLARLLYHIHSKTLAGKLQQMMRALQLELQYSKKDILEAYFNLAPYGHNIEGVGAASLIYFDKLPLQLALLEALTLSVIPQNPGKKVPSSPLLLTSRAQLFARWVKIHPQAASQRPFLKLPLGMRSIAHLPFTAPHFVMQVAKAAAAGLHIETTLNPVLQQLITNITRDYTLRKKTVGIQNGAVLLVDTRDMAVKAMVGSVNFFNEKIGGQINGTSIKRSPGSTLKPFIYGLAFDQGLIHPHTVLKDVPYQFDNYNPENFDYDFMGPVKAKDALILSRNIPAISLASRLHPSLYELLEKAQVTDLRPLAFYGLGLSLGGVELSMQELITLYAALVNEGVWRPLRFTQTDAWSPAIQLFSPEASFLVLDILKETPLLESMALRLPVSWKTGTSSGYRDAWTVGAFGPYVMAVWLGNFNNQSNPALVGKTMAAPLFFELVQSILQAQPDVGPLMRHRALNLKQVPVCKASGMLPTPYCTDTEFAWFIPGKSPITTDTIFREVAIDPQSGLRTCHINRDTQFAVYEFWPSDLLKIFKQAGLIRNTPPAFVKGCSSLSGSSQGPTISFLHTEAKYIVNTLNKQKMVIPLVAVTDADVAHLYWFANDVFLGKTTPEKPLLWKPTRGVFRVRVVDDHGLADMRVIQVSGDG